MPSKELAAPTVRGLVPFYARHGVAIYQGAWQDVVPKFRANSIDCLVTSPPYNQRLDNLNGSGIHKRWADNMRERAYADSVNERIYQAEQLVLLDQAHRVLKPTGSLFYNHKPRYRDKHCLHPLDWLRQSKLRLRQEIIWSKNGGVAVNCRMFCPSDERVFWLIKSDAFRWNQSQVGHCSVWRIPKAQPRDHGTRHPCPFPREIPRRCIAATTTAGDVVLDPYMGIGSSVAAAVEAGRRAIGVELERDYCEAAVEAVERAAAAV
ncbi:MAG: site-specific DNA-methyltransferase [Planctomycetales bacterium]|nr:site-specific DNA-methyltransferase [Planctomycetales bacterium]